MAYSQISVKNATLVFGTGAVTDFYFDPQTIGYGETQDAENTTPFGSSIGNVSANYGRMTGSGLLMARTDITGFANKGAGGNPGFGKMDDYDAGGFFYTHTVDSGATIGYASGGGMVPVSLSISEDRRRGGVPVSLSLVGAGAPSSAVASSWV